MKVLVLRASNSKNYGSLMMVANYINKHKAANQDATYIVDNIEDDGVERIRTASGVNEIDGFLDLGIRLRPECKKSNAVVKLFKYYDFARKFGSMIRSLGVQKVVFLGGDDISEYYTLKSVIIELIKIRSMASSDIEILMLGQTIGPFYSWRKSFAASSLSKAKIFTRDAQCAGYLRNDLKLTNVYESADLAYLPLPEQGSPKVSSEADALLEGISDYELIVTSGLWKSYTDSYEVYINFWKDYLNARVSKGNKLVVLSHVLSDTSSDSRVANELKDYFANNEEIKFITDVIQPVVAREIISRSKFTLSGRMHACVSSLQTGVPTIPLSYSVKFGGVIGELPVENYIIECGTSNLWNDATKFISLIEDEITKIESNGFGKQQSIINAVDSVQSKILAQIS